MNNPTAFLNSIVHDIRLFYAPLLNQTSARIKRKLWFLLVLSIASAFSELLNLTALFPFLRLISDRTFVDKLPSFLLVLLPGSYNAILFVLATSFVFLLLTSLCIRLYTLQYQYKLTALIANELATNVFGSVMSQNYAWHKSQNSSSSVSYITKDSEFVIEIIKSTLIILINTCLVSTIAIGLLIFQPFTTFVSALIIGLPYVIIYRTST